MATGIAEDGSVFTTQAVSTAPPLMVHVTGGVRLELTDAGQLALAAQLIQTLQRSC